MGNLKDVIDVDGTKRRFDIDTAELGEMGADQKTAVVTFREPAGEIVRVVLGRTSYRVLADWIAQDRPKVDRQSWHSCTASLYSQPRFAP